MKLRSVILFSLVLAFLPLEATAQANYGFTTGQVPTATQWNGYFSGKMDFPQTVGTAIELGNGVGGFQAGTIGSGLTLSGTTLALTNTSTTVNSQSCALGGSCTITAIASELEVGTTTIAGGTTGDVEFNNAGVLGEVGTTGSGSVVLSTSPTLVTPALGAATATSIDKVAITAPAASATLTIANGKTLTVSNSLTFTGTDASSVAFGTGGSVLFNGGALGTPSSGTLTSATGLPISTGVSGLGTGVAAAAGNTINATSGLLTYSIIGTSGAEVPLLNAGNTWSAGQTLTVNQSAFTDWIATNSSTNASGAAGYQATNAATSANFYLASANNNAHGIRAANEAGIENLGGPASIVGTGTVYAQSGGTGGVQLTNGATSWATLSDERFKNIIGPIAGAEAKVDALRAVIGTYKADKYATRHPFLIAQDVQKVLPEAVSVGADGHLVLRYDEIIPLLVADLKEQSDEIARLRVKMRRAKRIK